MTKDAAPQVPPQWDGERFMWLTPDRLLYVGILGAPTPRAMGCVTVYMAAQGRVRARLAGGAWQSGRMAVVPPYLSHQVISESRLVHVLKVEAETADLLALPATLAAHGIVDDARLEAQVRSMVAGIRAQGAAFDLGAEDFDRCFFGRALARRTMDPRIQQVIDSIKRDPSVMAAAEDCAQQVELSFSRFLHLFRENVGAPFRSFRTWKRARSLLHYVNRDANLAHVALDTGYPDSTHFSHSIRQIYGMKPKDMFAGSRRLAIYGSTLLT